MSIKQQVKANIRKYERLESIKRNPTFEYEQLQHLPKTGFTIRVITPKMARKASFKRGYGTMYEDNQRKTRNDKHPYTIQYADKHFHFQRVTQLLLWLYRRAETGMQYKHPVGPICLTLAKTLEQTYKQELSNG